MSSKRSLSGWVPSARAIGVETFFKLNGRAVGLAVGASCTAWTSPARQSAMTTVSASANVIAPTERTGPAIATLMTVPSAKPATAPR